MDKLKSSADLIRLIYAVREDSSLTPELVRRVCVFYDEMKNQELSQADLKFLRFLAVEAGIPTVYKREYFIYIGRYVLASLSERHTGQV